MQPLWSRMVRRLHEVPDDYVPDLERAINFYDGPEAQAAIKQAVGRALEHGTPWDLELPFRTYTGRRIWVRAIGEVIFKDGVAVRMSGSFQDITERHEAEMLVARTSDTLRELHLITSDWERDHRIQIDDVLSLGIETLGMQAGMVCVITGDECDLHHVVSMTDDIATGMHFPLQETCCDVSWKAGATRAIAHLSQEMP